MPAPLPTRPWPETAPAARSTAAWTAARPGTPRLLRLRRTSFASWPTPPRPPPSTPRPIIETIYGAPTPAATGAQLDSGLGRALISVTPDRSAGRPAVRHDAAGRPRQRRCRGDLEAPGCRDPRHNGPRADRPGRRLPAAARAADFCRAVVERRRRHPLGGRRRLARAPFERCAGGARGRRREPAIWSVPSRAGLRPPSTAVGRGTRARFASADVVGLTRSVGGLDAATVNGGSALQVSGDGGPPGRRPGRRRAVDALAVSAAGETVYLSTPQGVFRSHRRRGDLGAAIGAHALRAGRRSRSGRPGCSPTTC